MDKKEDQDQQELQDQTTETTEIKKVDTTTSQGNIVTLPVEPEKPLKEKPEKAGRLMSAFGGAMGGTTMKMLMPILKMIPIDDVVDDMFNTMDSHLKENEDHFIIVIRSNNGIAEALVVPIEVAEVEGQTRLVQGKPIMRFPLTQFLTNMDGIKAQFEATMKADGNDTDQSTQEAE